MRTKVCHVLNILGISTMLVSFVSGAQDCVMAPTQVSVYLNRWESFLHNRQKKLFLQSDCANYKYPHADANLGMLCMHMSSMTGCSLRKQCKSVRSNLIDFFLFFFIRVFLFILAYFLPKILYHLPREGPRDRFAIHSRFWRTCADRLRVRIYYVSANNHSTGVCFDV